MVRSLQHPNRYQTYSIMRKLVVILSAAFAVSSAMAGNSNINQNNSAKSTTLRTVDHSAFQAGEKLKYVLHYGVINAGIAELSVNATDQKVRGRDILHMEATGRSISAFDWFFKVRDRYETYMDADGVFPWVFVRRVNEGGYEISQDYTFYQHTESVKTEEGKTYEVPLGIQDMLSSFYYARTLDFDNAKVGDIFEFDCFVDEEVYPLMIKYLGEETIDSKLGTFDCLKFVPVVQEGRIFSDDEDLLVWITNDENKVPVLAEAQILVGSIKMELLEYSGLAHEISKVE